LKVGKYRQAQPQVRALRWCFGHTQVMFRQ
jgi:hypothetical protein